MTRFAWTAAIGLAAGSTAMAGWHDKTINDPDGSTHKYVVFVPDAKTDGPMPVVLFLHGSGETGTDNKKQAGTGLGNAIRKQEKTFPAIAVFPQSEKRTWQAGTPDGKRALAILDAVMKEYKGDPARVYLTGLSMGGFGTFSIATANPDRFAAIVPICGGGDPSKADAIAKIPCWVFHGDADKAVPVKRSRDMIEAMKKAGGEPKYTEYPGVGHNSWDKAYGTDELYSWLFAQKRK